MADNESQNMQGQEPQNNQPNTGNEGGQEPPKTTFTKEEVEAMLKDAEAKGYGKGKFDTNVKWEKTAKEREKLAKEEAEKQARFEKMSELEKAQTQAKESMAELQALKDELALNEQREETRKLMKDKDLSDVFLNAVLVPKDAEATLNNIVEIKALFDAEVQKVVESKITTHIPKQNNPNNDDGGLSEAMARKALKLS